MDCPQKSAPGNHATQSAPRRKLTPGASAAIVTAPFGRIRTVNLHQEHDRLPPVRGLLCARNRRGHALNPATLEKWLRLNREAHQCAKADVLAAADDPALPRLFAHAAHLDVALSLRCVADAPPPNLGALRDAGLFDLFLTPRAWDQPGLPAWLKAARDAGIPARVQFTGPLRGLDAPEMAADLLAGCSSVNVAAYDPFIDTAPCADAAEARTAIARINALTRAIAARGVEVNLLHLPFAWVDEDNLGRAEQWPQFFLDHQQYRLGAYRDARRIHGLGPARAAKLIEILLARQTSFHNPIDRLVLPWILEHPALYIRVWALHKLTRHLPGLRHRPRPLPPGTDSDTDGAHTLQQASRARATRDLASCRFFAVSDHNLDDFRRHYPGVPVAPCPGAPVRDLLHFLREQPKHYDAIDARRLARLERVHTLAESALRHTNDTAPTREIPVESYAIEGHTAQHMPGAVRWSSFANAELQSTVLARLEPPFTLGLTFGGGFAGHIGFGFGRHAKVICPMVAPSHRLLLHVAEDGHYALLRDGEPVRPVEFEGAHWVPDRLGGVLEPRISIWNIDGQILTQTLLLWQGAATQPPAADVKYSVIVVSTYYSRRLQAALLALAHQRGFDPARMEIIVAYVPGIDTTDDLIDSMRLAHPALRIVRSPFPRRNTRSKGFMINESMKLAAGSWVILLDSDIVLPPETLAAIDRASDGAHLIAPDGRVMLTPAQTAGILLGETRPWECADELAAGGGEHRARESDGIPIGFCQCVRRDILEKIPYAELDHFEGSDWLFGKQVVEAHGPETRLAGVRALHLDHGGSQWYGAGKQM